MQANFRTMFHRLGEYVRTQLTRETGGNRFFKEKPNMCSVARSRAFQRDGRFELPTGFEKNSRILLPTFTVEVHCQKETSLVQKHGINAHDKIAALSVPPGKMPADHFVGDLKKAPIGTIRAFDSWLLTNTAHPLIAASRCIPGPPCLAALETARIDIFPAAEKRSKQMYLVSGRRI